MANQTIVVLALLFIYFHISGLATTNILRLTTGNTTTVLSSKCCCDHCGATIPPHLQLPIISYIACRGKCKYCGTQIPLFPFLLELTVFLGMFGITVILGFTHLAVSISFLFYEFVRVVTILLLGKRNSQFVKQYVIAVLAMLPFYILTLFVALLYSLI